MGDDPGSVLALDPAVHPAANQQQLRFVDPAAVIGQEAAAAVDRRRQRPGRHHGPFPLAVRPLHPRDAAGPPERPLSPAHFLPARLLSRRRQASHFTGHFSICLFDFVLFLRFDNIPRPFPISFHPISSDFSRFQPVQFFFFNLFLLVEQQDSSARIPCKESMQFKRLQDRFCDGVGISGVVGGGGWIWDSPMRFSFGTRRPLAPSAAENFIPTLCPTLERIPEDSWRRVFQDPLIFI